MHNNRSEHSRAKLLIEKFWQLIRFMVVAGFIFMISFFIMNFSAYKKIVLNYLDPEAQKVAEEVLERASGQNLQSGDTQELLPVLNPDKKITYQKYEWLDNTPIISSRNLLIIPKINTVAPLVEMENGLEYMELSQWNELEDDIQKALKSGVLHYPGTAKPFENGNFFITGHSSYYAWDDGEYKDVFALLGNLEPGDHFTVHYDQRPYHYVIEEKKVVAPTDVSVLEQPRDQKKATLLTCWPIGSIRERLAIIATQIDEIPNSQKVVQLP